MMYQGLLGAFPFTVSESEVCTFRDLRQSRELNYVEHKTLDGLSRLQHTGRSLDPVSFSVLIAPLAGFSASGSAAQTAARLESLALDVQTRGDDTDRLIICLPEIAAAEAENSNADNRKGWLYLHDMFEKWLAGSANNDALNYGGEPLLVDLDWALTYFRAWAAYEILITPYFLFSESGKNTLTGILERDGKFSSSGIVGFDYINTPWTRWRPDYFQQITAYGMAAVPPDGLTAAMGNFVLRVLAKGFTRPTNGKFIVNVQSIAVIIWIHLILTETPHWPSGAVRLQDFPMFHCQNIPSLKTVISESFRKNMVEEVIFWCFPSQN